MLLYICVKFHENISNCFGITERTRFCDGQTDTRTDEHYKNKMSPNPTGGDIMKTFQEKGVAIKLNGPKAIQTFSEMKLLIN